MLNQLTNKSIAIFFATMPLFALAQHSAWASPMEADGLTANFGIKGGTNQQAVFNRTVADLAAELVQAGQIALGFGGLADEIEQAQFDAINEFAGAILNDVVAQGPTSSLQALLLVAAVDRVTGRLEAIESDPDLFAAFTGERDPALVFSYEITNPTDETLTVVLEGSQEIIPLGNQGDVQFDLNLEVIDNNGDGASASASGFATTFFEDPTGGFPVNTILSIGDGSFGSYELTADDLTPDADSGLLLDVPFACCGDPTLGQALITTIEISPGDTAIFSGFVSVGDDNTPLPDVDFLNDFVDTLGEINAFAREVLAIPEPSSTALLMVCGLSVLAKRRRRSW